MKERQISILGFIPYFVGLILAVTIVNMYGNFNSTSVYNSSVIRIIYTLLTALTYITIIMIYELLIKSRD